MAFLVDLIVLFFLGFCAYSGYKKGFFLTTASILIFFVSLIAGATVANNNVEKASVVFDSILDWVAEDATDKALNDVGSSSNELTALQLKSVVGDAFVNLGFNEKTTEYLSDEVSKLVTAQPALALYETISKYFIRALAWVALFFAGFVICALVLSLVANFISTAFKLPVVRQLDMMGGIPLGLIKGLLIMFIIGFGLRYLGFVVPGDLLGKANVLGFFINNNPFGSIIKL